MLPAFVPLLDHEMLFVTGKGGTGKTTVASALALAAARTGRRTIVCEFAEQAHAPRLLGGRAGAPGEEVQVDDHLWTTTVDSWGVLEEWVGKILGSKSLTSLLVHSNFFRAFADAAPGGMELGEAVKAWELAQPRRWQRQRATYDLVVVDGPASGHAMGMLRAPSTFAEIARVGPIASQSRRTGEWLADDARTAFVAVALAAELPVAETIDLSGRLQDALGRSLARVVVNGLLPDRFDDGDLTAIDAAAPAGSEVPLVAHAAVARAGVQAEQLARLEAAVDVPVDRLPFVFAPDLGRAELEALADGLAVD